MHVTYNKPMNIAWIGTGVMGKPMANHLSHHHHVTVFNRHIEKTQSMANRIRVATTLADALNNQDVVITMLGYPEDVTSVFSVMEQLKPSAAYWIDLTTSSPVLAQSLFTRAKTIGIAALDAPVTGGLKGALNQSLTIMVGGEISTFTTMKPLLSILGSTIVYMGEAGQGQHAKMTNQIAIAGQLVGLVESLSYAAEHKLDLEKMLSILSKGAAQSYGVETYGPKILNHDWQATFYLKHFLKDLSIALASSTTSLPMVSYVHHTLTTLVNQHGEEGVQSLIKAYPF